MPSFAGSGGPLRQKALWDLTLTCRTLTSYWVRSLARTWGSKSQGRSKSSGGFIWSDPRAGFFQKGGDSQINPKRLRPKPGTHLVFQAQLCWARFGLGSYPSQRFPGSGETRVRSGREEMGSTAGRREEEDEEGTVAWTSPAPAAYANACSLCSWRQAGGEKRRRKRAIFSLKPFCDLETEWWE